VFGGFLMKQAYETAWAIALLYSRDTKGPEFVAVDEVHFLCPVEIGSLVSFRGSVVFTGKTSVQVRVKAQVVNPHTGSRTTTNVFHFVFNSQVKRKLIPQTYEEMMFYVDGKRKYEENKIFTQQWMCNHWPSLSELDPPATIEVLTANELMSDPWSDISSLKLELNS